MNGGELFDIEDLADQIKKNCPNKKLTITGGEPLCQKASLEKLVDKLDDFDLCLYTSHEMKDVPQSIIDKLNYIKTGPFILEQRTTTLPYRGSSNQHFISLKGKEVEVNQIECASVSKKQSENASHRETYVGSVYNLGSDVAKENALSKIPAEWAKLHTDGHIHIHDLDAYDYAYNCITFRMDSFPYEEFISCSDPSKIFGTMSFIKDIISKVGNEQSGGMAFANFDITLGEIFEKLNVEYNSLNKLIIYESLVEFIKWCSNNHERKGIESEYVSLNIGLCKNDWANTICESLIDAFTASPPDTFRPNIIFKVKEGINSKKGERNYHLYIKSLKCTAKKMIPTYLLCDCESNKNVDPLKLGIMGCRTRIMQDEFGCEGAEGRGNICNITINLPRIALETKQQAQSNLIESFEENWTKCADTVTEILLDRYKKILSQNPNKFPTVKKYNFWCKDFEENGVESAFKHGTLSIGFIGLSDTFEILTGKKFWSDDETYKEAYNFVKFMRQYIDKKRSETGLNFSLLATSGEMISGRFPALDKKNGFNNCVLEKGFYTNSFHVDVDSKISAFKKLQKEGPFHTLSNGGCISYVELNEAPLHNVEALEDLIACGAKSGVHYLGINFPLDVCNHCGTQGVFDVCPDCGCDSIMHIRRVSGYLEIRDYFTTGKKSEESHRRENTLKQ
jgi:ribonucleoside-triphosphate reductase